MAVPGPSSALKRLDELLAGTESRKVWQRDKPNPKGLEPAESPPTPVPDPPATGYLNPNTYFENDLGNPDLNLSHAEAAETFADEVDKYGDYCRRSTDITMRGGTTSGIVYPLAVCEIARAFRLRNIGGTSAGAIAAAAAAAAELGRIREIEQVEVPTKASTPESVQRGFAGVAEVVRWLTQLDGTRPDTEGESDDEFRLAGLFRPNEPAPGSSESRKAQSAKRRERRLFGLLEPIMRRRNRYQAVWRAALALGLRWCTLGMLISAGTFALLVVAMRRAVDEPAGDAWGRWGSALGLSVTGILTIVLVVVSAVGVFRLQRARGMKRDLDREIENWIAGKDAKATALYQELLKSHTSAEEPRATKGVLVATVIGLVACVAAAAAFVWIATDRSAMDLGGVVLAALLVLAFTGLWALVSAAFLGVIAMDMNAKFRSRDQYGLFSGDRLVAWIDARLRDLAGQERPLTFGDLWGVDENDENRRGEKLAHRARARRVNLQLVTTDLAQQRPFLFPFVDNASMKESLGSQFYVDRKDLAAIFPPEVVDLLAPESVDGESNAQMYKCWGEKGKWERRELCALPEPWDLPVVFAVRASMALPFLFKAVRVYRLRKPTTVRDDMGRPLEFEPKKALESPMMNADNEIAEELWLSDGGITSNFPVHLFDQSLPEWPTFGLNLGRHPRGFEHQDVWFPEDWQSSVPPYSVVRGTAAGFVAAIVSTARTWRDVMQTNMPSTRGRVAWVRQRAEEGGTNLFMRRETVASMALRGALAGARLRHRFAADEKRWKRHKWLRLRAAVSTLDEVCETTAIALPAYRDLFHEAGATEAAGKTWLEEEGLTDEVQLFIPSNGQFWDPAKTLLQNVGKGPDVPDADLRSGAPTPAPEFRQSPRM
ncbi:hypothetical protein [Rhodococcus sp. NPDC003383]